jgi:hypothetical protein
MNQIKFDRRDYTFFIFGMVFLSFGVTIPIGITLLVLIFFKKINQIKNDDEQFSTLFFN